MVLIILNGKRACLPAVRNAIATLRTEVEGIYVRVTYEYGDVEDFMHEALAKGVKRIMIAGGDGSINEIVNAMAKLSREKRPELAIVPLGTANDFATACRIPLETLEALRFGISGTTVAVDIVKANDKYFINVATVGFGAKITAETPEELKHFLGGGAYTLTGVLKAIDFVPYTSTIETPEHSFDNLDILVGAVCNGRQAGGGQVLGPRAYINDGLLDVISITKFSLLDIPQVLNEIKNPSASGKFVKYIQTSWLESRSKNMMPVNLDGEPYSNQHIRFEVIPLGIDLVIHQNSPCLK